MSKYELPSGAADIDATGNRQEIDFRYPQNGKDLRKAMQEALVELWKAQERIAELEHDNDELGRRPSRLVPGARIHPRAAGELT